MRRKIVVILVVLYSIFFVSQKLFACNGDFVNADQSVETELHGILRSKVIWGPPNFGETPNSDRKEIVWYIILEEPINFRYEKDREIVSGYLKEIRIYFQPVDGSYDLNKYVNLSVKLTGDVWSSSSEGDVTPVVMHVKNMEKLGSRLINAKPNSN